jgi:HEPN domain-containing protein
MPPDHGRPGDPRAWLRHASSDLALARVAPPVDVMLESLCYHAQQAAEKALKAVLLLHAIPAPRTHSIRTLLDSLPSEVVVPQDVERAAALTAYAIAARYPGDLEPIEEDEYREAVRLAAAVVAWAGGFLQE